MGRNRTRAFGSYHSVMRFRFLALLAVLAIAAAACGSVAETVDVAAPADIAPEAAETGEPAIAEESAAVDEPEAAGEIAETTTTTPESTLLPSGRERILANHTEGKPYLLWYWGAH